MMLSVQDNFGYVISVTGQPTETVPFLAANAPGNGLIVVAYFMTALAISPSLAISDTNNNSYLPLGACSVHSSTTGYRTYLAAWHARSCARGSNAVTVTETIPTGSSTYLLAVSVFEYAGGYAPLDASAWGDGVAQTSISLSLATSVAGDLIFCYGGNEGLRPTVSLDPSSSGFTTEQTEQINNQVTPTNRIVELLAVDKIVYASGVHSVTLDFAQALGGADTMFVAALPLNSPPPAPPTPPPPTPPPSPVPGSAAGWPTIF